MVFKILIIDLRSFDKEMVSVKNLGLFLQFLQETTVVIQDDVDLNDICNTDPYDKLCVTNSDQVRDRNFFHGSQTLETLCRQSRNLCLRRIT